MADWVHCNMCFRQPGDGKKFSLTNCGHIYCDSCVGPATVEKCKMCGAPCSTIVLSAKMKPDVEIFFTDPAELTKKHQKQLVQVMDFQKNHRQRLTAHNREKMAKQDSVMTKARKLVEQNVDVEREIILLKEENSYLKKLISNMGGNPGRPLTPGPAARQHLTNMGTPNQQLSHRSVHTPSPTSSQKHRKQPGSGGNANTFGNARSGSMSGRIVMRTPPSQGRMGTIPSTPSPSQQQPTMQPMHIRLGNTPGVYDPETPGRTGAAGGLASPMNVSPAPNKTSLQGCRSAPLPQAGSCPPRSHSPGTHLQSSQSISSQSSQWDPSRRQIQLSYYQRPHSSLKRPIMSTPGTQTSTSIH